MGRLSLCVAVVVASVASRASAALEYFAWTNVTPDTYTATAGGVGGGLTFSTPGDDLLFPNSVPATAAGFTATYGAVVPAVSMNNGTGGSAAAGTAVVQFDAPLPAGSRLIAFDVDAGSPVYERFQFSHTSGTLTLIDQLESQAGASSIFPTWSAVSGTLTAQRLNDREASVFDVSGAQSLTVNYLRDAVNGGVTGGLFAIGVPVVPEPTCAVVLPAALLFGLTRRARKAGRSSV